MKVVLFCGGLGTRIREYSESIPKPMIPVGNQPILWHVMQYYSQYGHQRFRPVPWLQGQRHQGFLPELPHAAYTDCVVSGCGRRSSSSASASEDWRVTLIDTGIWRNIGERLWAVREHVEGRGDVPRQLQRRADRRAAAGHDRRVQEERQARLLHRDPPAAQLPPRRLRRRRLASSQFRTVGSSDIWINGGYFIFRAEIFDYMREGEELVLEPFKRLIEDNKLMAYKHEGFWRAMDTLRDRQILEDMVEHGNMPWRQTGSVVKRHDMAVAGE